MKRIIGFTTLLLAIGLFSCNTSNDDNLEMADLGQEVLEKSAQITVNEVKAEAAITESDYEVQFYANAEHMLTNWWRNGKQFMWNNKLRYHTNQCPNVDLNEGENDGYPKTITLDYGDSTVLRNGKVLSGLIVIEISAPRSSQDFTREVTYTDFGVDSLLINGTATIVVDKVDSMYRQIVSNLTFTFPDGTIITRTSERIWQWISGLDTEYDQSDDVVTISGSVTATILWPDGTSETYTKEITSPLKRMAECRFIVEGVVEVHLNGNLVSVLDYGYAEGDAECDQYAKLTTAEGDEIIDLAVRNWNEYKHNKQHKKQSGK